MAETPWLHLVIGTFGKALPVTWELRGKETDAYLRRKGRLLGRPWPRAGIKQGLSPYFITFSPLLAALTRMVTKWQDTIAEGKQMSTRLLEARALS